MSRVTLLIGILAGLESGWMAFDGTRALIKGDYVTPRTGAHGGELGPWAKIVSAVGIEPRSTGMKLAFVAYGTLWLGTTVAFVAGVGGSRTLMLLLAIGSVWYAPIGTLLGLGQVILLLVPGAS